MINRSIASAKFYIEDHAVLYALLVRAAVEQYVDKGEEAARKATIVYARERGLRMAMRCAAAQLALTGDSYLEFGEWVDDRNWSQFKIGSYQPFELNAHKCGWYDSWQKHSLLDYGKLYCEIIDSELYRGFNPEIELTVKETISHGDEKCSFLLSGVHCKSEAEKSEIDKRRKKRLPYVVKDFLYHTGHVFSAFKRTYLLELGLTAENSIVSRVTSEYEEKFGKEKMQLISVESEQNFLSI